MQIQDFCAGCMGVLVVDREARRALFSEFPNASDLVALSCDNPAVGYGDHSETRFNSPL